MEPNLGLLDSLGDDDIAEIDRCWCRFCECVDALVVAGKRDAEFVGHPELESLVGALCRRGLFSIVRDYFLQALEDSFKVNAVSQLWLHFDAYGDPDVLEAHILHEDWPDEILGKALAKICMDKAYQEKCLILLASSLQSFAERNLSATHQSMVGQMDPLPMYQMRISAILLMTLPSHFPEILRCFFRKNMEGLSKQMADEHDEACAHGYCGGFTETSYGDNMDIGDHHQRAFISKNHVLVTNVGKVVNDLRSLGFASVTEDAYASAIFSLLKETVHSFAGDDYRNSVLESVKEWIRKVPLQFLHALFSYLGDNTITYDVAEFKSPLASRPASLPGIILPSEGLVRWQLRLEYFAYETLQDLRIGKLFEIIVDYPDSSPAIEDLRQCLEYTGQYSKLVDSFISALRYRLLTAGASTNDILLQYVSTIKALRTIDPTGVFLEAVGEPIRDYLKRRKDTIKCVVTMLTDGTGGNPDDVGNGTDNLLEELNKESENQDKSDSDDDIFVDNKQAWLNAERWEPDPVEADPEKGSRSRRKLDILEMMIGVIGSKDQLVNEYRVMLAEKLLNKSDYDTSSDIRTLELLKIHFGEGSMQKCEIMLNDLIDSKMTNSYIKASIPKLSHMGAEQGDTGTLDIIDATIISTNFWPSIQSESINIPASMEHLLSDYAKRYHELKAPRRLSWMKNLGTVKLELQFVNRNMQFSVAPVQAAIIMKFQEKTSWILKDLATAIGLPIDSLAKKITFWISKGIVAESLGSEPDSRMYTIMEEVDDNNRNDLITENCEELLSADDGESSVASFEEQLRREMTVFEKFIIGMLTNFGSMTLDRIHNTLKMFCIAELTYDKTLQQLQTFLSGLIAEEKLEMRDGAYVLKK